MWYHRKRERWTERERKREGGCSALWKMRIKDDRCRKCWNYRRKVLPSELTNTIEQFIVYVHRNEADFTNIYVSDTNVFEADNVYKNPPLNVISPTCFAIFISLWDSTHDSADCWSAHRPPAARDSFKRVHERCEAGWRRSGRPQTKILATPLATCGAQIPYSSFPLLLTSCRVTGMTADLSSPHHSIRLLDRSQSSTFQVSLARIFPSCFWSSSLPFLWLIRR